VTFVGLFGDGAVGGAVGFGFADFQARCADLVIVVHVEFIEGAHSAAVGATRFGDGVLGFIQAMAVLAPVAEGIFEATVAADVFATFVAALHGARWRFGFGGGSG